MLNSSHQATSDNKAPLSHTHSASDITTGTFSTSLIPNLSASKITSGTLSIARGGTNKSSWTANRLIYPSSSTAFTQLAFPSVAGSVLRQGTSGAPYWSSVSELGESMGVSGANILNIKKDLIGSWDSGTNTSFSSFSKYSVSNNSWNDGYLRKYFAIYIDLNYAITESGARSSFTFAFGWTYNTEECDNGSTEFFDRLFTYSTSTTGTFESHLVFLGSHSMSDQGACFTTYNSGDSLSQVFAGVEWQDYYETYRTYTPALYFDNDGVAKGSFSINLYGLYLD